MSNIYYVSKSGCDNNTGSKEAHVRTIEKAQALARENKNSAVYILEGEYKSSPILDERDSGTKYIGNNVYKFVEDIGFDMETLKFKVQPKDFPEIPVDEIGRIK